MWRNRRVCPGKLLVSSSDAFQPSRMLKYIDYISATRVRGDHWVGICYCPKGHLMKRDRASAPVCQERAC